MPEEAQEVQAGGVAATAGEGGGAGGLAEEDEAETFEIPDDPVEVFFQLLQEKSFDFKLSGNAVSYTA